MPRTRVQAAVEPPVTGAAAPDAPVVKMTDASVRLGGREIWSHVSFRVNPGEFVAILGPNGGGKSTLLKVILGLVPLAAGSLEVAGRRAAAGRGVGYLPQRRMFDPSLRIRARDVAQLGLDGARWGVPLPWQAGWSSGRRAEERRLDETLELVGARGYADRPIGELSGGEQQRVLIARALVHRPALLLLDEPLESLDLRNQQAISGLARRICQDHGVTVMMVAHDVNPIVGDLDRVLYLAGGGAAVGPPEAIISTETLTRLYGVPIEVMRARDGRLVVVGTPESVSYHAGH